MSQRSLRSALFALVAALGVGCDKGEETKQGAADDGAASEDKSEEPADEGGAKDDDREARRAARKAAKASFAEHSEAWEKLVVANDVDAIQAMWAKPEDLSGCVRKDQEFQDGKMVRIDTDETWAEQVAETREGFDSEAVLLAELKHGETFRHRAPLWSNRSNTEAFGGAECAIEFHGEVWFDALVEGRAKTDGVRHRAYFALVGDDWKLLRINGPDTVKCDNPADRAHEVCKKVRGEEVEP